MSPIDDELHAALHSRAATIAPPPDPMAGVERQAAGIRRRRLAATLAGGAVLIAVAAVMVPTLLPGDPTAKLTPATQAPSPGSEPAALDPDHPWAMRGGLSDAALAKVRDAWAARHRGSTLTPLFGQVDEPSARPEVVFVATGEGGARYGFATASESTAEVVVDEPLAVGTTALTFALTGDEVPRLLVVAAGSSREVGYLRRFGEKVRDITAPGMPGIGLTSLEGDLSADRVEVVDPTGLVVYDQPAPDPEIAGFHPTPENVPSSWPQRGTTTHPPSEEALRTAFAQAMGRAADVAQVSYRSLYVGDTGKGEAFTMGQAWFVGDSSAYNVSYTTRPQGEPVFFLGRPTSADAVVLAFLVPNLAGMSDLLVVVPQPNTGQVLYDDDATGAFRPITGQDQRDGVVLIDRSTSATDDRLQLLNGNGDLDHPTYEGPVAPLLCGLKECG